MVGELLHLDGAVAALLEDQHALDLDVQAGGVDRPVELVVRLPRRVDVREVGDDQHVGAVGDDRAATSVVSSAGGSALVVDSVWSP